MKLWELDDRWWGHCSVEELVAIGAEQFYAKGLRLIDVNYKDGLTLMNSGHIGNAVPYKNHVEYAFGKVRAILDVSVPFGTVGLYSWTPEETKLQIVRKGDK